MITSCAVDSGRQGDPGETRFYLSLEDDVDAGSSAGERIQAMMNSLKVEEDVPIGAKMLSNTIARVLRPR